LRLWACRSQRWLSLTGISLPIDVKSLHIYPVKSCAGQDTDHARLEVLGLSGDRRAMIVDENGKFLTQRSDGQLALIKPVFQSSGLSINLGDGPWDVELSSARRMGTVWNDQVDLRIADERSNQRLSEFLKKPVTLLVMDEKSARTTSGNWTDSPNSLSDGYPLLITTTASLKALSQTAGRELSMKQFRPNIVINVETPWIEDHWQVLRIGEVEIELVKPCTRCHVTTLNPVSGKAEFPETMEAMIKTRRSDDERIKGVLFGWNAIVRKSGILSKGEAVKIVSNRAAWPIQ